MSAWVVSKHHIDLLVSSAIERRIFLHLPNVAEPVVATLAIADLIGTMLWRENIRSVAYRYNLCGKDEEAGYLRELAAYRFRQYTGVRAAAASAALACYDYQSCECPDYRATVAAHFVDVMLAAIGPCETGNEPWGFDTAESVTAATVPG